MSRIRYTVALPLATLLLPLFVFAAPPSDFTELVDVILNVVNYLIPLVIGLTFLVLMWGIVKAWILKAGDEAEIEKGKRLVTIGVVVLVIVSGFWGIIRLLLTIFGL